MPCNLSGFFFGGTDNILKQAFNLRFYLSFFVFIVICGFFLSAAFSCSLGTLDD